MRSTRASLFRLLAVTIAIPAFMAAAPAQEVTTQLSSAQTRVGEPVQLTVTVTGGRRAQVPQTIAVNGLQINLAGQRSSSSMQLGAGGYQMNSTTTYVYMVVPQTEGDFTIPPFEVKLEARAFRTQPMRLSVRGGASAPPPQSLPPSGGQIPQTGPPPSDAGARPYFGELVLSKKKAYVGEVIPAELRFYFSARVGGQLADHPAFGGEGFTVQKFSNASKREQVVDGESYSVFTFQTSITPAKSGTIEIPPAKLDARLQVPGNAPQGLPDILGNLGQMLPPGMFSETREISVETRGTKIEVMPLPKEGRPEDFSGAIGKFTLDASVTPKKAGPGDPVTLKASISGQGNFEAMGPPTLTEDENWRSYPPSDKINPADAIGYTAEKTFEFALIARADQSQTPGMRFSYFDPSTGKYETINQPPLPVTARAASAQQGAATPAPDATPTPGQSATPPAIGPTPDIAAMAAGASNWLSIFQRRDFLVANAALALAWFALVAYLSIRRYATSAAGHQAAKKRRAKDLLSQLRSAEPADFWSGAEAYLCTLLDSDPLSLPSRIETLPINPETRSILQKILDRHAEAKYAAGGPSAPSPEERSATVEALSKLPSRHGK